MKKTVVKLFSDTNLSGQAFEFTESQEILKGCDEITSSIKITGENSMVLFYEHAGFSGKSCLLREGEFRDHKNLGIKNDRLSSLLILLDEGIYLFEETNFQGNHIYIKNHDQIPNFDSKTYKSAIVRSGEWIVIDDSGLRDSLERGTYDSFSSNKHSISSISKPLPGSLKIRSNSTDLTQSTISKENTELVHTIVSTVNYEKPTVEIVMDASGSMAGSKIELAKKSIKEIIDMPDLLGRKLAIRVFGPDLNLIPNKSNSLDIDSKNGLSLIRGPIILRSNEKEIIQDYIDKIPANGGTPIAGSLRKVKEDLSGISGLKIIALLTDGEANEPDEEVQQAILDLTEESNNAKLMLNIIGFNLSDTAAAKYQRWAELGKGQYYNSDNNTLMKSMKDAIRIPFTIMHGEQHIQNGIVDGDPVTGLVPKDGYSIKIGDSKTPLIENISIKESAETVIEIQLV